jgi:hypothetical protein
MTQWVGDILFANKTEIHYGSQALSTLVLKPNTIYTFPNASYSQGDSEEFILAVVVDNHSTIHSDSPTRSNIVSEGDF